MTTTNWNTLNKWVEKNNFDQITLIGDATTMELCLPVAVRKAEWISRCNLLDVDAGEESKDMAICEGIWQTFIDYQMSRKSLVVNLGGGVVCDLGGFAASVYMRGIPFVNIPTSLLAMVDAAIGGKNGINFAGYKNYIGTLHQAQITLIDDEFLATLPDAQRLEGLAEMIKHACIADTELFNQLFSINTTEELIRKPLIKQNIRIKQNIVKQDPFEKGLRKALNFGHTTAHALESIWQEEQNQNPDYTHGLAVAMGIWLEAELSTQLKTGLTVKDKSQIQDLLSKWFDLRCIEDTDSERLIEKMKHDKKNSDGKINFTLIGPLGQSVINQYPKEKDIQIALERLKKQ